MPVKRRWQDRNMWSEGREKKDWSFSDSSYPCGTKMTIKSHWKENCVWHNGGQCLASKLPVRCLHNPWVQVVPMDSSRSYLPSPTVLPLIASLIFSHKSLHSFSSHETAFYPYSRKSNILLLKEEVCGFDTYFVLHAISPIQDWCIKKRKWQFSKLKSSSISVGGRASWWKWFDFQL